MFQKFSLICPTKFKFFLYPNRYSPILVLIELKQIDFIEKPVLDFKIVEICLSLIILFLMIFRSLIRNVKIIKTDIINKKHVSAIIKPDRGGSSIKTICFNCLTNEIGKYLLTYKKKFNIIAQIHENEWNNKKTIQLNIKDLIL